MQPDLEKLFEKFKEAGKAALTMNHYELALNIPIATPDIWKWFLQQNEVNDYIQQEFTIIQSAEMRKIIANASEKDTSVGKAQLINAMMSVNERQSHKKDGPIIIYTYIQPNEEQKHASNVVRITEDPFLKWGENGTQYN